MNKDLKKGSGVKSEISPADGKPPVVRSASTKKCWNCKHRTQAFKIGKLTHYHCSAYYQQLNFKRMENIKEQFARLYMELDLTDDQAAMIKKLQRDVDAALRQPLVSGELADFARFLSEEYSIEIHERIIDEWNKYYSANYR